MLPAKVVERSEKSSVISRSTLFPVSVLVSEIIKSDFL